MTICIIIATRNAGHQLHKCLDSILTQDFPPTHVIVQDGASNDDTVQILRGYEQKLGAVLDWRSEPDCGIADAWNRALKRSKGDWILFLGGDDTLYDSSTLGQAAENLQNLPNNIRVAYGRVELCNEDGTPLRVIGRDWSACSGRFRNCLEFIPHQGTFHHQRLFTDHGEFDTSLAIGCDYDFLLRELTTRDAHYMSRPIIARMTCGGLSTTRQHILKVNTERIRLYKRYVGGSVPLILHWKAAKALVISILYRVGGDVLARRGTNIYRSWIRKKPSLPR